MELYKQIYVKMLKKEMNDLLNSGSLTPEQQYSFIEKICQKLVLVNDKKITETIENFNNDLQELEDNFKKQYQKYLDTKAEMSKDMYEAINKL